jgi:DNA polymerase I-like protein with 3'-5' exonuclease and polymerase domains
VAARKAAPLVIPESGYNAHVVLTTTELHAVVKQYSEHDYIVFDCETVGTREAREGRKGSDKPALDERTNQVLWIALAAPGLLDVIPMGHPDVGEHKAPAQLERFEVISALKPLFFTDRLKINQNVKFDVLSLSKYWGEIPPGPFSDTITLAHLLNENLSEYNLAALSERYLGYTYAKLAKEGVPMDTFPFDTVARYVGLDAKITQLIYEKLRHRMNRGKLEAVLQLEDDITEVLIHMKQRGALVEADALDRLDVSLRVEIESLSKEIFSAVGHEFLISSGKQLAKVLYEELGLPIKVRTDKAGAPATSEKALLPLVRKHPVVPLLLRRADVNKLQTTYSKGLRQHVQDDDRIRTTLNQNGAVSGRFTSSSPNLQNIPRQSDDEDAARIRSMFVAPPGYLLVVGDFGQVEARLMAHYGGPVVKESRLLLAFNQDIDFHTMTASGLFHKPVAQVTKEERQAGKTCNFLLIFGGSANKLIESGGYSTETAEEMFATFHKTYPEIKKWGDQLVAEARQMRHPTVETVYGRRRRLPDLLLDKSSREGWRLRASAERQAVNSVIQGSAADINKAAMVRAFRRIQRAGKQGIWHIILTVHDEIILEVPEDDAEAGIELLRESMERVKVDLRVPLVADIHAGPNWSACK